MAHHRTPFPLLDQLPDIMREVILDFHWDPDKLHALPLPEQLIAVPDLSWQLALPFWAADGQPFRVSPMEVAAHPDRYPEQWARINRADLAFPLDAWRRSDGQIVLLDGLHRLLKAYLQGLPDVRVRILSELQYDAIAYSDKD